MKLQGWAVAATLAAIAILTSPVFAPLGFGASAMALVLGLAMAGSPLRPYIRQTPKVTAGVLLAAVVGLGFGLPLGDAVAAGPGVLAIALGSVAAAAGAAWVLQRVGRVPRGEAMLLAIGTGICGASAIVALRGSTDATEQETTQAVAMVTLLGTVGLLLAPFVAVFGNGPATALAAWAGASLHAVPQAVGAGSAIAGDAGAQTAALVKLARVALLPLVAVVLAAGRRVPKEVLWFLAAVATGAFPWPPAADAVVAFATRLALTFAMAGLGMQVSFAALRSTGTRSLAAGLVIWAAVLAITGLVVWAVAPTMALS